MEASGQTPILLVLTAAEALSDAGRLRHVAAAARKLGLRLAVGGLPCAVAPLFRDQEQWPVAMLLLSASASGSLSPEAMGRLLDGLAPERLIWCADDGDRSPPPRTIRLTSPW